MSRVRTHKKTKFTVISNETLQQGHLSFSAIGLLVYCLSMPEDWEFRPRQISSKNKCGRDQCYDIFNELIDNDHCIRIEKRNGNLKGGYDYEIFDDQYMCRERKEELKKILRYPGFQDPGVQDPENTYTTKKHGKKKLGNKDDNTVLGVCVDVDKSSSKIAASKQQNRPLKEPTPTVLATEPRERCDFDPFSYELKNGKRLDIRTARSFAKYFGDQRERLLRNVLWYEKQIDQGILPNKSHDQMLQWAIKNDMASKESYVFQNELYAKFLLSSSSITGLQILKTVVRIPSKFHNNYESLSLTLPHKTFTEALKKYITS